MITGIHHVALSVADIDAAEAFYTKALGLQRVDATDALPLPAGIGDARLLAGPNSMLRLLAAPEPAGAAIPVWEAGITHFCAQSVDAPGTYQRFSTAGASFHSELTDLGTGYLYCYARDPEGNVIEIEGVAPVWTDERPWFAHAAISTPDLGRMADFYAAVLGSTAVRSPRFRNNRRLDRIAAAQGVELEAAWIPSGNIQVELMQYYHPATVRHPDGGPRTGTGYSYIALEVDDVVVECRRLESLGATTLSASATDHAWCADPDGNRLLLIAQGSQPISALPDPLVVTRLNAAIRQASQESKR